MNKVLYSKMALIGLCAAFSSSQLMAMRSDAASTSVVPSQEKPLCPICHEEIDLNLPISSPMAAICGMQVFEHCSPKHLFHGKCVAQWMREKRDAVACPLCRAQLYATTGALGASISAATIQSVPAAVSGPLETTANLPNAVTIEPQPDEIVRPMPAPAFAAGPSEPSRVHGWAAPLHVGDANGQCCCHRLLACLCDYAYKRDDGVDSCTGSCCDHEYTYSKRACCCRSIAFPCALLWACCTKKRSIAGLITPHCCFEFDRRNRANSPLNGGDEEVRLKCCFIVLGTGTVGSLVALMVLARVGLL